MRKSTFFLLLVGCLFFSNSHAMDGVTVSVGDSFSGHHIRGGRVALRWNWGLDYTIFGQYGLNFSGYFEPSVGYWHTGQSSGPDEGNHLWVFAISPVLEIAPAAMMYADIQPYIELGIGLAGLTHNKIADRDLATYWQFEDRAGVGAYFGAARKYQAGLRIFHYSNASAKQPNDGFEVITLHFTYLF